MDTRTDTFYAVDEILAEGEDHSQVSAWRLDELDPLEVPGLLRSAGMDGDERHA
jgi:hypothetical protein